MTSLRSRLLLLVVAALALAFAVQAAAPQAVWPSLLGPALAIGITLFGAQVLIRRSLARLLTVAERLRAGDLLAGAGLTAAERDAVGEFGRLGAALDAVAAAQEGREQALRDALATAELTRAALGESEARLRLALAAADVSVYEIDLGRGRVWLDDRAASLSRGLLPPNTWLPVDDTTLRAWLDRIHPEDWEPRRAALLGVMQGAAETLAITYRFRDPQGVSRWIAERGAVVTRDRQTRAPLRIVGVSRDVTEQIGAAEALEREVAERTAALAESEQRFRGIFDSAFQLTGLLTCDGVLLEANRAALDFLGRPAAAVRGRALWEIGAWGDDPRAVAAIQERVARAAAGEFVRYEFAVRGPEARRTTFDFSLKPVFGADGAVTMLVAEARDLTERTQLQAQLAQAQKMEAVGQLTGGVAHDFNNLLQALTGNLDLIHRLAEARDDQRLLRLTASAERAAARGARLTQQLLAFSRRQNLRPERVCVSRLIGEIGELLRRAAGETIEVRTQAAPGLWACHVDPSQFESALLNLAINARDAMPQGGALSIHAGNAVLVPAEAARLEVPAGDYVRVDVNDTGTGIAPEHLPRLFEPFFTTKEVGKGTGLGLAMVHGFARQSGGAVTVVSEPGRGAIVSLFLPRETVAEPSAAVPERERPAQMPPRAGGMCILVVEDEPEVLDAVQFALVDAGHRVLTATDGAEALALLAGSEAVDLLLCDIVLPGGLSGIDIAGAARRDRPGLRVLLASGYGTDVLVPGDGTEILTKPFTQAELLRRVAMTAMPAAAG